MKALGILRFELGYQLRRPWPWAFFVVVLVLDFLMTRDNALAAALHEDFFVNSPFAIAKTTVFGSLIWLLMAAPVAGDAAARDVASGMAPLTRVLPLSRLEQLAPRFFAALVLNALILLAIPIGILLALHSPGVDAATLGPFRPAAYLGAWAFIALPNAFVATAVQFALAAWSGRPTASYLGSLLLFFMGFFVAAALLFKREFGSLLDPIGVRFIVEDLSHAWTTQEKSWRLLALEEKVLANRVLWTLVGAAALAITWARFPFADRSSRAKRQRPVDLKLPPAHQLPALPAFATGFGMDTRARQLLAVALSSTRALATSWAGLGVLVIVPALTVLVVVDQMAALGAPVAPTTSRVLRELTSPVSAALSRWVIIPALIVFFAGELVWRERDAGVAELTDALPVPTWVTLLGKLCGLALLLTGFLLLLAGAGMAAQGILGHSDLQPGLYLGVLLGLQLPEYLLFAVLAFGVHAVVDQKYLGHLAGLLAFVFIAVLAGMLGLEHNLLVYGGGPAWAHTELRGFGGTVGPWLLFKVYWAAWAVLLGVGAKLFWVRGREVGLGHRLALARPRLTRATVRVSALAGLTVLGHGAYLFHNTNVLNAYQSRAEQSSRRAEYERRYQILESQPQPQPTAAKLQVDLYPARRAANLRGEYVLENVTEQPMETLHLGIASAAAVTTALSFDREATLSMNDEEHGHRSYTLNPPLAPGEAMTVRFEVGLAPRGFGNRGYDPSLAPGGGSLAADALLPAIGYQRHRELFSPSERREHGLPARSVLASLYETEGREPTARAGGVRFDAVVSTEAGQVAVAPGDLRRTWSEGGRTYFHYASDTPIGAAWTFFSAAYALHEERWREVTLRIFHHPAHGEGVERTSSSVRAALEYYSAHFGTYPHRHLTLVEHAGAPGIGLHAEPGLISFGEGFLLWRPEEGEGALDFPAAVVAHEVAHQWTVPYAVAEGAPFLSEGLAWYSAIQAVKASRGMQQLHQLLSFMREPHPFAPIRRGEPLLRALDPYLAYRRGPFALYALSEYAGEQAVNGAIRRLIEAHEVPGAPPATTLDLYRSLQAAIPAEHHPLLGDLFERNTLWAFSADRATLVQRGPAEWEVTLRLRARKSVYDASGVETELTVAEAIPVGVFGEGAAGGTTPLHLQLYPLRSGEQTLTITVDREPARAGVDPFHLLDWDPRDDNVVPVLRSE